MDYLWGTVNQRQEADFCLRTYFSKLGISVSDLIYKHIKSGFTDNVFMVSTKSDNLNGVQTVIFKEYLENWHKKEITIYKKILQHNYFLGSPKLIIAQPAFIILEFLSPKKTKPISAKHINKLKDWLIKKHNHFKHAKTLDNFSEDESTQIHYLVDKPLNTLKNILPESSQLTKILSFKDHFISTIEANNQLPPTLEHGDLEPQNLFIDNDDKLRVIDWVNSRKGSGLFDINQYFETAEELGCNLNRQYLINQISKQIKLSNLKDMLLKVRQLMLLNKLNFYGEKYTQGKLNSFSKSKPTLTLFNKYLTELQHSLDHNN